MHSTINQENEEAGLLTKPQWTSVTDAGYNNLGTVGAAPQTVDNQHNKRTLRDGISSFTNGSNTVLNQPYRGVNQNMPLEYAQDSLNPTLRQTRLQTITIDSNYRPNKVPHSSDPYNAQGSDTNFTFTLSESLKNVVKLELKSVYIPPSWYTYSKLLGNVCFWIAKTQTVPPPPSTPLIMDVSACFKICIDDGNYTTEQDMVNEINKRMEYCPDLSGHLIAYIDNSNVAQEKINFKNNSSYHYRIIFYSDPDPIFKKDSLSTDCSCCFDLSCTRVDSSCNNCFVNPCALGSSYNENLGYYLGFRATKALQSPGSLVTEMLYRDIPPISSVVGEVPIALEGSEYILFVLDDFNKNSSPNGAIGIAPPDTRLSMPKYFFNVPQNISAVGVDPSNVSHVCYDPSNNKSIYLPTYPRTVTQNQLYALNEIIYNRKLASTALTAPSEANTLALLYPPTTLGNSGVLLENGQNGRLGVREYFGPVTLERMSVKLLDARGRIVSFDGLNWSFTLTAYILYQY